MPFAIVSRGVYQYQGVTYNAVECGGGGNCLFLSIAAAFRYVHADDNADHAALRARASDVLFGWALWDPPGHIDTQTIPLSDMDEATELGTDGVYGGKDALVAILEDLLAKGTDVRAHVLGPTTNDVFTYRSPAAVALNPTYEIHLLYIGFAHYRLLVRQADIGAFDPGSVVALNNQRIPLKKAPKKVSASLKLSSDAVDQNTTVSSKAKTILEIHHIDVGQGDAALVMIRDVATSSILRSILIDASRSADRVTAYFDTLIQAGRFKPVDTFFASHYDNDHIGGAAALLDSGYVDPDVVIYDGGDPPRKDTDFDAYSKMQRSANRCRPPLHAPILDNFHGVTLRCICMNGLVSQSGMTWSIDRGEALGSDEADIEADGVMLHESLYPTDKNDWSLGLTIEMGCFSYFTAGDLSGNYEFAAAQIINAGRGYASVLKAGHHGAGEATTGAALSLLKPRLVVISCGYDNDHGHPAQSTMDRLDDLNTLTSGGNTLDCTYLVTGTVTPEDELSDGKFPAGQLGKYGADDQGTVVVEVTDTDVVNHDHSFMVYSKSWPTGEPFDVDDRTADIAPRQVTEYRDRKRRRKGITAEMQQERKANRDKRRKAAVQAAKDWLLNKLAEAFGKPHAQNAQAQPNFNDDLEDAAKNLARSYSDEEDWPKAGITSQFINRWRP
jgi:competence protein ComEC